MSVYFITCRRTGTVKIGSSLEPHGRLRELQTSHPFELKLEASLPGSFDEEGDLHYRFAAARLHGEWFAITPEIEALIAANPPGRAPANPRISRAKAKRPPIIFGETAREYEARLIRELREREQRAAERWLEENADRLGVSFPFRDLAALEDGE